MKQYFALGSYTEPILFGTGEVFQGKGTGVTICSFEEGDIKAVHSIAVVNPSFLCIDEAKRKIYAVNERKTYRGEEGGGVTQLCYDAEYALRVQGDWNTGGKDPCHIAIAPNGRFLAISNFASGSVSVFPLEENGDVRGDRQVFAHEGKSAHPVRQRGPHAHSCVFSQEDGLLYVPDLGTDQIAAYRYAGAQLERQPALDIPVPPGSGPRYGEFSRDGKHFYLMEEISSQVAHFTRENGRLIPQQAVSTLPEDFSGGNIGSDLHLTPDGAYLYAANRGHESIACYRVAANGALTFLSRQPCGGRTPRNFAIDPTGRFLLVGNQDSDTICVFRIQADGSLRRINETQTGSPVCIRFFLS